MKEIIRKIDIKLEEVNNLLRISNKQIAQYNNIADIHIQSSMNRGYEQFYCVDRERNTRKYLRISDLVKYSSLIQRDYDIKVNKKLVKMQKKLTRIAKDLREIDLSEIKAIYNKQPNAKKPYITPIIPSDEDFIARWYEENKGAQNTFPIEGNIYTERGEHVRSKSEKILADLFYKYDIPYVYEPKVKLSNGHMVCPDFALLNKETRQTIYWEHLGLINQDEYAVRNLEKLHEYEESSLILGENLLISMESTKKGLNTKLVEMQIKKIISKTL